MCSSGIMDKIGADPLVMQWTVVRGDTSPLSIQFLEDDEVTFLDTTGWTARATSYDPKGDVLDDLDASIDGGVVTINVPASITEYWGSGYKSVVSELRFDLQITKPNNIIWTPVIGTIRVLGDVTPGGSL